MEEANATLVRNVSYDNGNWQFTGLTAGTTYYFKIYPYNGTGASVNYKTDGTVPEASSTTSEAPLLIDFDTDGNWTAGAVALGSYASDHVYNENNWTFTGGPALRNGTTAQDGFAGALGTYSWRLQNNITVSWSATYVSALNSNQSFTGFGFDARRWDNSPSPAVTVEYSLNGGTTWTIASSMGSSGILDNAAFGNSSDWSTFAQTFSSSSGLAANQFVVRLTATTGERIMIDNFTYAIATETIPVTSTYTGTGNWTDAGNWSNGLPGEITDVTIDGAVTVNDVVECNNMIISTGGSVTVQSGQGLIVNGNFLVQSDASGTGSFIGAADDYDIEGTQTVERYISGHNNVADAGWHLLGSPVAAFDIDGSSFDPGASDDFYAWQESNSTWMNHKQGTPSQIVPGAGYLVSYETSGAKTFTGSLNAADQTVTVTREGAGDYAGFNLIGNPFASAITWGSGWSLGSVGGVAYVWDEATKDYIDIEAGDPIPSANGVMVYLGGEETSQSLTIPAAARIHSSQGWYKSAGGRIVLVANDPDRGAAKRSVIRFNESATEGFDLAWDGYYLRGFAPGFYSVSNGMNYSVNTLPSMNNTLVIPMGFEKTVSSGFSIELQESIPGAVVYLTDKKTGTVTNLTDNGAYHFTAAEGDDANRFTLHFGTLGMDDPSTTAPVNIYAYGGVVYLNGLDAKASVTLTDLTGRVVMAERVNGNGLSMLNAAKLPKGVYVVTAVAGSRVVSAKVIL
ncbi:hypothetical protein DSECCO2_597680 [anaerobic digester metagenome]